MKETTRRALKRAAAAAGMSALLATASACGGSKRQETTAPESSTAAEETVVTETSAESTEAAGTEASAASGSTEAVSSAVTSGKLTEFLTRINENFTEGGSAGISLRAASCAADLMSWYMEEKPEASQITGETRKFTAGVSDAAAFKDGLSMIRDSAEQTCGSGGEGLLSDAGWSGTVTWTAKDVTALFDAIDAGTAG
jgi:hypothetical protein